MLVRHGQARLFTDDYDRLSRLGVEQAQALATRWLELGIQPDQVWSGNLQRQVRTAEAVAAVFLSRGRPWPKHATTDGLNEYPAEEIMTGLGRQLRERDAAVAALAEAYEAADDANRYRHFHRLLSAVMSRWVAGDHDGISVPTSWAAWSGQVRKAFADIMAGAGSGKTIAVFTSGGVIGVSLQTVLAAPALKAAELSWRVHNASVTRYTFSGERVSLDHFNDVAHLPASMLTYR